MKVSDIVIARARLLDLRSRISVACANPDQRPNFVHWSDVQMLSDVIEGLDSIHSRDQALNQALSVLFRSLSQCI